MRAKQTTNEEDMPWIKSYPPGLSWELDVKPRPLWELLDRSVKRFPNNNAIDFYGKKITYSKLNQLVDRAAKGFQEIGVKKGTHVGIFLPNCPQYIIAYYGILKAGGTVVNFSPLYAPEELKHQIEDSEVKIMVTMNLNLLYPKIAGAVEDGSLEKVVITSMPEYLPFPKNVLFPLLKGKDIAKVKKHDAIVQFSHLLKNDGRYKEVKIDPAEDLAVIQYTGGTTGIPKGAMLTHANAYINTIQAARWFVNTEEGKEKCLGVLPFFHVFAMTVVMNLSLYIGAEIVMYPRFELATVVKTIHKKRITMLPGVPTMYQAINNYPLTPKYDLTSIKACISGGAPLPQDVKEKFEEITHCTLVEGYGLTEASPVVACNPLVGKNKVGSIGLPLPGTTILFTDLKDKGKLLKLGEKGEICIKGPQVMKGYWKKEGETKSVIVDGLLHTGDVGYMDDEGYIYVIDRIKDLILAGGYNVYPRNVEEAIYRHPAVKECTVIGVPDEYRGQNVKAFVALKEGEALSEKELLDFLQDKLGRHELPRLVEFRDELPKTAIGKLSKKELIEEEIRKYEQKVVREKKK